MDPVGLLLVSLPIPILVACIVWFTRLDNSRKKGERLTLKLREMGPLRKALAGIVLVWICLNLYLSIGNLLALMNIAALPFGWIYSSIDTGMIWGLTVTMVSLAIYLQLKLPKRLVTA